MIFILGILIFVYLVYTIVPTCYYKVKMRLNRRKKGNVIYLTFDDGPSEYTPVLLDLLKKYDIHASFFLVSSFARDNSSIVNRMISEGHLVGMHSYSHKSAHLMGVFGTSRDFDRSIKIMNEFCEVTYYRPSWGALNLMSFYNISKYKLKLVLWNVMAEDWKANITDSQIEEKLLNRIKGNDIICLHDGRGKNGAPLRTIMALERVIPLLLDKGYRFELVDKYEK